MSFFGLNLLEHTENDVFFLKYIHIKYKNVHFVIFGCCPYSRLDSGTGLKADENEDRDFEFALIPPEPT